MRRKRALFSRDAERLERRFHCLREGAEFRSRFDPGPEDARAAFVREKSHVAKNHFDGRCEADW